MISPIYNLCHPLPKDRDFVSESEKQDWYNQSFLPKVYNILQTSGITIVFVYVIALLSRH